MRRSRPVTKGVACLPVILRVPRVHPVEVTQVPATPLFSRLHLPPGTRLGLAVSGGGDSVALLRIAHMLRVRQGWHLRVLHVHHGIRAEAADLDASFVESLTQDLGLSFQLERLSAPTYAAAHRIGLEEAGRLLRYGWFGQLLQAGDLDAVATGHTLEDQSETVLARMIRGGWTAGLSGIHPAVASTDLPLAAKASKVLREPGTRGWLVRPLLGTHRGVLRVWLQALGQGWREDETNSSLEFTRNRIRHEVLPILARINPQVDEQLSAISTLARDDEAYWQAEVSRLLPGLLLPGRPVRGGGRASSTLPGAKALAIEVERLRALPPALVRRLLRATAQQLGAGLAFEETERAFALLDGPAGSIPRREQLSAELRVERSARELRFVLEPAGSAFPGDPEAAIEVPVPGEARGFGVHLRLSHSAGKAQPAAILRAALPTDRVQLRYSSGAAKRVKEVLERMGVAPADRPGWPVLVWQGELVWMRGTVLEPTALSSQLAVKAEVLPVAGNE